MQFLILVLVVFQAAFLEAKANGLQELNEISLECFQIGSSEPCKEALKIAEFFQRKAASRKNFRCQTFVLGLEAELLMRNMNLKREGAALEMLEKVNQICN